MEKEISSGTMLGIVLISLGAILGLGFGVFAIARDVAGDPISSNIIYFCLSLFSLAVSFIGLGIWLKYKNEKHNIWDNIGNEHRNILSECDKDKYNEITTVSIPMDVSLIAAARCRLSKVRRIESIDFERYIIKEVKGTVKINGNFYIVGDKKLARGLVLLTEGETVDFKIKTFLNLETALGIYRVYDVI